MKPEYGSTRLPRTFALDRAMRMEIAPHHER
jgi:hypothetical protein